MREGEREVKGDPKVLTPATGKTDSLLTEMQKTAKETGFFCEGRQLGV